VQESREKSAQTPPNELVYVYQAPATTASSAQWLIRALYCSDSLSKSGLWVDRYQISLQIIFKPHSKSVEYLQNYFWA